MHGIKWSKKLIRQQLASHVKYTNSKDKIGLEKILICQTIFLYISNKHKVFYCIPYWLKVRNRLIIAFAVLLTAMPIIIYKIINSLGPDLPKNSLKCCKAKAVLVSMLNPFKNFTFFTNVFKIQNDVKIVCLDQKLGSITNGAAPSSLHFNLMLASDISFSSVY